MTGLHIALGVALFFLILLYLTLLETNKLLKNLGTQRHGIEDVSRGLCAIAGDFHVYGRSMGQEGLLHELHDKLESLDWHMETIENKLDYYLDEEAKAERARRWERPF